MRQRSERGFTLIELLTVVLIIVILGAVAVPNIMAYIRNANIRAAALEVKGEIQRARSQAIMKNTNNGVVMMLWDDPVTGAFRYRMGMEDNVTAPSGTAMALDVLPWDTDPQHPQFGQPMQLPQGVVFDPFGAGRPNDALRFDRLGRMCEPGANRCGSAGAALPNNADYIEFALPGTGAGTATVRLLDRATGLRRNVTIDAGGKIEICVPNIGDCPS